MKTLYPIYGLVLATWIIPSSFAPAQVRVSFTEPVEVREVAASEPGAVSRVHVEEGQLVKVGQRLAELQSEELRQKLRLAELKASSEHLVNSAQALVSIRQRKRDTLVPMLELGHANQAEVEKAILDYESAFSELQAAKQTLEENRIQVDLIKAEVARRTILSPINGFVTEVHRKSGEFISGAEPKFATVACLDQLRVRFYLLPETIDQIDAEQPVSLLLGATEKPIEGSISFVSPVIDPDSGTTRVDVLIKNHRHAVRAGIVCRWNGQVAQSKAE